MTGGRLARGALAGAALCVVAVLAACSGGGAADEELRIGMLLPMSGTPALTQEKRVAEAYVERVNAEGGLDLGGRRVKVRLLVEDTGGQVERVMAATVRLISQGRVSALVGPYYSRDGLPAANVAEQSHVPMVSPTASSDSLTRGRKFVFRVCVADAQQGPFMARFAREELALRQAAVLFDEADAYSIALAERFSESFVRLGGQVVAREPYATGGTDHKAQLARIRASGAQALFLPNFTGDVPRQMVQARAAGFAGVFLGGDSWSESPAIIGQPEAEGAYFSTSYSAESLTGRPAEEEAQLKRKGFILDTPVALTLDALGVILAGARAAGSADSVSLREGIASLRGYEGFTGRLSFENGGDAVREAHIMVIEGGRARCRKLLGPAQWTGK